MYIYTLQHAHAKRLLREDPLPITVCIAEPGDKINKQKDIQEIHCQELYAKENLVREICPQKDVQGIHSKNCMQRRTW
jgi:hypothetical protein